MYGDYQSWGPTVGGLASGLERKYREFLTTVSTEGKGITWVDEILSLCISTALGNDSGSNRRSLAVERTEGVTLRNFHSEWEMHDGRRQTSCGMLLMPRDESDARRYSTRIKNSAVCVSSLQGRSSQKHTVNARTRNQNLGR